MFGRLMQGYTAVAVVVLVVVLIAAIFPSKLPRSTHSSGVSTAAIVLGAVLGVIVLTGLALFLATRGAAGAPRREAIGAFLLQHRLLRGYAPAVVLLAVIALVATLVPSTTPPVANTFASRPTGSLGSTGTTGGQTTAQNGQVASGATSGAAGSAGTGAVVSSCSGNQVPGDPYAPPCTQFAGNNGGATAKGVDGNTITVTARLTTDQNFQNTLAQLAGAQLQDTNADNERTLNAIVQYFNTHFQFYGRKIVVKYFTGQGSLSNELQGYGQGAAEADAATAQSMGAFADLTAESEPYATALWQDGVMGFGDPYMPNFWHQQHAPYDWSIATDGTDLATDIGYYAVSKLCNQGAAYAGGSLRGQPRKIAGIAPQNELYQVSVQVFSAIMHAHGCDDTQFAYTLDLQTESQQAANLVAQLKAAGYTTIVCGCDPIFPVYLSGAAAQQNYFPEFVEIGAALVDQDYVGQLYNQQFYQHAFGISPNEATVPYTQTLGYAAYEVGCQSNPSICSGQGPSFFVNLIYVQMAMLAIGIQMAGPDLTPATFQKGMFAYPPREGPYGQWGWSPTQYTTPNDFREVCWSPNTISPYNGKQGAYIQGANNGARWTASSVPGGAPGCPIPSS
ncbi:MAG TPA: hypothetical protein DCQ30_14260 [Acidimicrobiaceae bacterium]|nr:hypothetical protein [Acidimicrobiaceae bacterium]